MRFHLAVNSKYHLFNKRRLLLFIILTMGDVPVREDTLILGIGWPIPSSPPFLPHCSRPDPYSLVDEE